MSLCNACGHNHSDGLSTVGACDVFGCSCRAHSDAEIAITLSTAEMPKGIEFDDFAGWTRYVDRSIGLVLNARVTVDRNRWGVGDCDTIENASPEREARIREWLRTTCDIFAAIGWPR